MNKLPGVDDGCEIHANARPRLKCMDCGKCVDRQFLVQKYRYLAEILTKNGLEDHAWEWAGVCFLFVGNRAAWTPAGRVRGEKPVELLGARDPLEHNRPLLP